MNKIQLLILIAGLLMIAGGILLVVFPGVVKYIFSVLGIACGIFLIGSVIRGKK